MATRDQIARAVDAHVAAATAAGKQRVKRGELAISARYDARSKRLRVELASGVAVIVPTHMIQGLVHAPQAAMRAVQVVGKGYGLHWPALDVDISVPDLVAGCFGTRAWMTALARRGGQARSEAKAYAARENGKKGGGPGGGRPVPDDLLDYLRRLTNLRHNPPAFAFGSGGLSAGMGVTSSGGALSRIACGRSNTSRCASSLPTHFSAADHGDGPYDARHQGRPAYAMDEPPRAVRGARVLADPASPLDPFVLGCTHSHTGYPPCPPP